MKKQYDGLKVFKISLNNINTMTSSDCDQMIQLRDPDQVGECTACGAILKQNESVNANYA